LGIIPYGSAIMNYWQELLVNTANEFSHRHCQNFSFKKLDRAIFISLFSKNCEAKKRKKSSRCQVKESFLGENR
jgi:hypothetical protein